jgi:hypothetical protein
MLSYAQFVYFAARGARWGDLEVMDTDDIEAQIAKNPIKLRKVVVREEVAVVVVPKIDWSLRRKPTIAAPEPKPDIEEGWAVVKKKPVPEWRKVPATKPATKPGYKEWKPVTKPVKAEWTRKPCCSYFEETGGKKHGHDCKPRKN